MKWGSDPGTPYVRTAPSSYASTTNRMLTATQKTLADESGGPLANLLVSPQDGGDGDEDTDPLAALKRDIRNAAGAGLMVETTNAGWGEGKASAPQGDWTPKRYGPMPPAPLIELSEQAVTVQDARKIIAARRRVGIERRDAERGKVNAPSFMTTTKAIRYYERRGMIGRD